MGRGKAAAGCIGVIMGAAARDGGGLHGVLGVLGHRGMGHVGRAALMRHRHMRQGRGRQQGQQQHKIPQC